MKEQFANEIVMKLTGRISDDDLKIVRDVIMSSLANYDITERDTEIAVYESFVPRFYEVYLAMLRVNGRSIGTIKTYNYHLVNFFMSLQRPITDITHGDIYTYLLELQMKGTISNRTIDHVRIIINTFLDWCYCEGYIKDNPCKNIKPINYVEKDREPLTDIELEMVRESCNTLRERTIIEVMYSTGCRVSEMVNLKISDVDIRNGEVKLFGKGGKYRTSFLSAKAKLLLNNYLKSRNDDCTSLIVTDRKPIHALQKTSYEKILGEIGERANIKNKLTPHILRHTFATNLLKRGASLEDVQKLLGHEKPSTTLIYTKINMDKVKYEHERYIL